MTYQNLMKDADVRGIEVYEVTFRGKLKGLYQDKIIWLDKSLSVMEKHCILAEEIGHYETTTGDILDQTDIRNRKQELKARQWAYQRIIPLPAIVQAYHSGAKDRYEIAEFLNVTEEFLQVAVDRYKDQFGLLSTIDNYIVYLDPLRGVKVHL
ncbi:ImmA/IrrE family metallo-endopeptidase [Paenibacillus sp. LMG 31459]|uniref:ImmA/IrrE family metallo-endopeptidase n=1 Tax=Paenibacillus phytohabitans TaxID=2654978 RepID=A0ABX1YW56_9BACL|nr:ImmA/IrrE family metallo-endopeptidase [Paenibacillus phytohabitans]NOU83839.1 ImmA/IrrE family metallo-endopeptidase [Paenibacillus phytohabitans]